MHEIRVLMVDDEEDFRNPVARYLTKGGMKVLGVGSTLEMDRIMDEFRPDIVLLDVSLPVECGFDAARRLTEQSLAGIIMLTARGTPNDRIEGLRQGADAYLTKPVNVQELELVIGDLYKRISKKEVLRRLKWI